MAIEIKLLYFEGCPNHAATARLLREVLGDLGVEAGIQEVEVKSPEDATRLRFFGSPTVQVDGLDLDPFMRGRTDFSFGCRVYGRSGTPPRELVELAVEAARRA